MSDPILDHPDVLRIMFHPRREYGLITPRSGVRRISVEVEPGVAIGGRLYPAGDIPGAGKKAPVILYFHGNGEIAADYDGIAPLYRKLGVTLLVADYRGYGTSGGVPQASALLPDALAVYAALGSILEEHTLTPERLYLMGRSLGSAAAIEIALHAGEQLAGLIIESGFADTFALLARLGVRVEGADDEQDGFGNLTKMGQITMPTLIIHGEEDWLIPPDHGQALYDHCAAPDKRLLLIPHAGHNDIMMVGRALYFQAIGQFVASDDQ